MPQRGVPAPPSALPIDERALAIGTRLHVAVALKPSRGPDEVTHALTGLPFVGILVGIFFANRTEPFVLGLPFALFWVMMWVS